MSLLFTKKQNNWQFVKDFGSAVSLIPLDNISNNIKLIITKLNSVRNKMIKKEKVEKSNIKTASFEEILRIYSNTVKMSFSLYDFQLIFGNAAFDSISENQRIDVQAQMLVHMSPQHFKVMVGILNNYLEKYEKDFGKIAIPTEPPQKKKKASRR